MNDYFINLKNLNDTFLSIWILDENKSFIDMNKRSEDFIGYKKSELVGKHLSAIRPQNYNKEYIDNAWKTIEATGSWYGHALSQKKNGQIVSSERAIFKKIDSQGNVTYVFFSSEVKEQEFNDSEYIKSSLLDTDYLTGFISKHYFLEVLKEKIADSTPGPSLTLVSIDTDKMESVNEVYGFEARDEYIRLVGEKISKVLPTSTLISRFSGDQFSIIFEGYASSEVIHYANMLKEEFKNPLSINGENIFSNVTIGISPYTSDVTEPKQFVRNSNIAKNIAKDQKVSYYRVYTDELNERFHDKIFMEKEINKALEENQFELYFQPQYSFSENKVNGFEALIRWNHPEKGLLMPDRFIPFAEANGIIVEVGKWILRTAFLQSKSWQDQGYRFVLHVNLSAKELGNREIVTYIKNLLTEIKVDPDLIGIELTESVMIENVNLISNVVKDLNQLGIRVGIDDFGTSHASLSNLIDIPLDFLKIDRSFLFDITNKKNKAIISLSLSLAQELGLSVVAEGVETKEHVDFLKAKGCQFLQGYYFSKPLPLTTIENNMNAYASPWF